MALNIFPRRREAAASTAPEPAAALPEPSAEALEAPRRRTRTTRARPAATVEVATALAVEGTSESAEPPDAPAPRSRRAPRRAAAVVTPVEPAFEDASIAEAPLVVAEVPHENGVSDLPPAGRSRSRRGRGGRGRGGAASAQPEGLVEGELAPDGADAAVAPAAHAPPSRLHREAQPAVPREGDVRGLTRAIELQSRQIEQIIRSTEELARRGGAPAAGGSTSAPPLRVGVFVDSANIELACDRLRARFDWAKVLRLVVKDRQLIRAIAYSPVHEDPGVSIETQRFIEPFLDRGFKLVTKPFRRFQDGTIKANLDIELALDVVSMLDRLDVVVLISGDGDFQKLVELAQSRGVRVEVAAVGTSTATNLRHAADEFLDLGGRVRDIRV